MSISSSGSGYAVAPPAPVPAQGASGPGSIQSTPAAGVPLVNGTQTFFSWTAPNDGKIHGLQVHAAKNVVTTEVGGAVQLSYTIGGVAKTLNIFGGGAAGPAVITTTLAAITVDPGTTVTLQQNTALTGGQSSLLAAIVGAV